jgi:4-amino-4-deoxy-L-arabinose transferase-like glycosyltransferase
MMERLERILRRYGALLVAMLSPAVVWFVWGEVRPVPVIHDEASYLLQADIFASGRWTAPTPPIPEFFEQPHVQVTPALASKYPPGHALLLALGALVRFPPLVPLLLSAITAALLFALAARVTNPWVALLGWAAWLFSPIVLRFQPSYLSELTTTALVLGSWWCLLDWRETRRPRWLLLLALLVGWGAITRPLTMLVFAIPIGVVVVKDAWRLGLRRDLGLAVAVGVAVLSLLPLWSARTTGSWRLSPVTKYRLDYLPFDRIGFSADTSAPRRQAQMSEVLVETYAYFLEARKQQTLAALPVTAARRLYAIMSDFFRGARLPLFLLFVVGLFRLTPPLRMAALSAVLLYLAHLPYAHWPGWTLYYLEAAPVLALITAAGGWTLAGRLGDARSRTLVASAAGLVVLAGVFEARAWRGYHLGPEGSELHRQMAQLLPSLPSPGILFVRYSPRIPFNPAIVRNSAHPEREPMWIVHDRGAQNADLLRLAPGRASHVLDIDRTVRDAQAR